MKSATVSSEFPPRDFLFCPNRRSNSCINAVIIILSSNSLCEMLKYAKFLLNLVKNSTTNVRSASKQPLMPKLSHVAISKSIFFSPKVSRILFAAISQNFLSSEGTSAIALFIGATTYFIATQKIITSSIAFMSLSSL